MISSIRRSFLGTKKRHCYLIVTLTGVTVTCIRIADGNYSFEESHELFRDTFTSGFPWEVLKVLSGPPHVVFTWRHWGKFDGNFRGNKGNGEVQ